VEVGLEVEPWGTIEIATNRASNVEIMIDILMGRGETGGADTVSE
jgi:hypothetical protein